MNFAQAWTQVEKEVFESLKRGTNPEDFEDAIYSAEPFVIVKPFEQGGSIFYFHARGYGYDIDLDITDFKLDAAPQELMFVEPLVNVTYDDFCYAPKDARERLREAAKGRKYTNATRTITIEDWAKGQIGKDRSPLEVRQDLLQAFGISPSESQRMRGEANDGARKADLEPNRLYRWQCNGKKVCLDCRTRHGGVDTGSNWTVRGLPRNFGSRCSEECHCTLADIGDARDKFKK